MGIRRVTGLETTTTEESPCRTVLDPVILATMMRRVGAKASEVRAAMPEVVRAARRYYLRVCQELRHAHCPGVEPLLERLTRRNILLALVTGNLTRIGWRKLERAGLHGYFRFGAFGEMAATRAGLAKLAIRQARREALIARDTPISLIGDATSDVIAAHANGIRAISVQTGITP